MLSYENEFPIIYEQEHADERNEIRYQTKKEIYLRMDKSLILLC